MFNYWMSWDIPEDDDTTRDTMETIVTTLGAVRRTRSVVYFQSDKLWPEMVALIKAVFDAQGAPVSRGTKIHLIYPIFGGHPVHLTGYNGRYIIDKTR